MRRLTTCVPVWRKNKLASFERGCIRGLLCCQISQRRRNCDAELALPSPINRRIMEPTPLPSSLLNIMSCPSKLPTVSPPCSALFSPSLQTGSNLSRAPNLLAIGVSSSPCASSPSVPVRLPSYPSLSHCYLFPSPGDRLRTKAALCPRAFLE